MPGMDGFHLLKEIRKLDKDIPYILCITTLNEGDIERAKLHGLTGYILKPFEKQDFIDLLRKHI